MKKTHPNTYNVRHTNFKNKEKMYMYSAQVNTDSL